MSVTLKDLGSEDRMRLMRFVCSFAWADLTVVRSERELISKLIARLQLDESEAHQVKAWLEIPPKADELDPFSVPAEHRELFLTACREMVDADGVLDPHEAENLELFEQLLG